MKFLSCALFLLLTAVILRSQDHAKQIYDTERAFERAVAEKGINAGFVEYLAPLGVIFRPQPVNGREWWNSSPPSPAVLTWNPVKIEVSSNGALAYSVGNSIYKPNGKTDVSESHGHYLSIWARQSDGQYRAVLDVGINHEKPARAEPTWVPEASRATEANPKNLFAGDSSIAFFRMAEDRGIANAYKSFAADDIYLMRTGKLPFVGRDKATDYLGKTKLRISFPKRRSFIEAGDLAYVYSTYSLQNRDGVKEETGNFVQVWKLRDGRWRIAADVFIPLPAAGN